MRSSTAWCSLTCVSAYPLSKTAPLSDSRVAVALLASLSSDVFVALGARPSSGAAAVAASPWSPTFEAGSRAQQSETGLAPRDRGRPIRGRSVAHERREV